MKLSEFVQQLEHIAASDPNCDDPEVVLYDKNRDVEYTLNPDTEQWDYEVLRGDGEIVIEFAGLAGAPGSAG